MGIRLMKVVLVACAALFAALVVFNNVTDYGSNYAYVSHVLSMDTTFPDNRGMWRRITTPALHHAGYIVIILFETLVAALLCIGTLKMYRRRFNAADFQDARTTAAWGLTAGIALWFGGFIAVGGEWFLMWQSEIWNGQEESAMFAQLYALILIVLLSPDRD